MHKLNSNKPGTTKNLELDWYEYLLRDSQRMKHIVPPTHIPKSNRNIYYAIALMFLGFALSSYILSYFVPFTY